MEVLYCKFDNDNILNILLWWRMWNQKFINKTQQP